MKKVLLGLALSLGITTPSLAADKAEFCVDVKGLAEIIMESRLVGVDVVNLMKVAGEDKMQQAMVRDAFSKPSYQTPEHQADATREFGAKYYLDCLKRAK
ncbi:hypothetical protein [Psychrobacter sp. 72-O-c]|uniref:hypothetical protein n=1 Tax=Psychrobacter sp. 72-O-c TaxID=2774125 RepID=UPI001918FF5B|nr:hypothetical protein [Psychrobacter sp. 72-O-c]